MNLSPILPAVDETTVVVTVKRLIPGPAIKPILTLLDVMGVRHYYLSSDGLAANFVPSQFAKVLADFTEEIASAYPQQDAPKQIYLR